VSITADGGTVPGPIRYVSANEARNTITVIAGRKDDRRIYHLVKQTEVMTSSGKAVRVKDLKADTMLLLYWRRRLGSRFYCPYCPCISETTAVSRRPPRVRITEQRFVQRTRIRTGRTSLNSRPKTPAQSRAGGSRRPAELGKFAKLGLRPSYPIVDDAKQRRCSAMTSAPRGKSS
jgi:hypothetical protein